MRERIEQLLEAARSNLRKYEKDERAYRATKLMVDRFEELLEQLD